MNYWHSLILLLLAFIVSACSGGSSQRTVAQSQASSVPASVNLSVSPTVIDPGESVTLTWSSTNATECQASGGWTGTKQLSGTVTVTNIIQDTSFRLSCSGEGGGGLAEVTVQVNSTGTIVTLRAAPEEVVTNGTSTLTWDSANATSCTAGGAWSGTQPLSGNFVTGALTQDSTYRLTCDGPAGSAVAMVTVRVLSKTL